MHPSAAMYDEKALNHIPADVKTAKMDTHSRKAVRWGENVLVPLYSHSFEVPLTNVGLHRHGRGGMVLMDTR